MTFYVLGAGPTTPCNFCRIPPKSRLIVPPIATRLAIADALLRSKRSPEIGTTAGAWLEAVGFGELIASRGHV
jgi:hypothetical protein